MIKNYVKVAIRNLWKNRGTTLINLFGLAVGMTCAVLIFLWVQGQLSYDKSQIKADRIYRLENETWVVMPPWLRDSALAFPEVEKAVRFYFWWEPVARHKDYSFTLSDFALVDKEVFEVFSFDFLAGKPGTALDNPYSLVLTQSTATRLFGDEDPMGQVIRLDNSHDFTITGVVRDMDRFHMDINAFASVQDKVRMDGDDDFLTSNNFNFPIYLLLVPGADIAALTAKIDARAQADERYDSDPILLRPFADIYFARNLQHEHNTRHGNINMVLAFSLIAFLILAVACINFINLTIARTGIREKEIAVRKVAGAQRGNLQRQFFGETLLQVLGAAAAALLMIRFLLPRFSLLTGEAFNIKPWDAGFLLISLGVILLTAFLAGLYPSFYLASLAPVAVLKGRSGKRSKAADLSRLMISFQFVISIALIIASLTVMKQLSFMQTADLGMDTERIITTKLRGERFQGRADSKQVAIRAFKDRLLRLPSVMGVTFVNQIPGAISSTSHWDLPGREERIPIKMINTDPEFVTLLGLEILEGRNFSLDRETDMQNGALINEEAARRLGLARPLEAEITFNRYRIIGLVKDFHFNSMHNRIDPVVIRWNAWPDKALIKIAGGNISGTIEAVRRVYETFCPGFAMEHSFLDTTFARQYEAEKRLETIVSCFVGLTVLLSCLGLFALSAFVARRKTKEIGIRKILGSSNLGIFVLLSKSFVRWILLANVVAWPVSYIVMSRWLKGFAYRIDIGWSVFVFSGALALAAALLTVSCQAFKAASANPADSLKYE